MTVPRSAAAFAAVTAGVLWLVIWWHQSLAHGRTALNEKNLVLGLTWMDSGKLLVLPLALVLVAVMGLYGSTPEAGRVGNTGFAASIAALAGLIVGTALQFWGFPWGSYAKEFNEASPGVGGAVQAGAALVLAAAMILVALVLARRRVLPGWFVPVLPISAIAMFWLTPTNVVPGLAWVAVGVTLFRHVGRREYPQRARTTAFRTLVVVCAVAALVPGFGLADLTTPLNPTWDEGHVAEVGYGALAGILLPVGFLAQLRSPERRIAGLQQVAAAVPAYIAAGLLSGDDDFLPFALIVAAAAAITVALHPARRRFVTRVQFRPSLALLALAVAAPAILYGLEAAENQRDGMPPLALDSHGPLNSWAALAAAAFALALVALLTSLGTGGFPIPGWSAGAAAAVWGLTALAHPDDPGSEGRGWASFAVVWALVFVAAVERERRHPRAQAPAGAGGGTTGRR